MISPLKNKKLFCTYHHRYNIKKCMKHKSSVGIHYAMGHINFILTGILLGIGLFSQTMDVER